MKLNTIRIPCLDLAESERYYGSQLKLKKRFGSVEEGFIGFSLDNVQLIIEIEEVGEFEANRYLGFSVEVADIFAFYQEMKANGVHFTNEPQAQDWGGIMTHIVDPSGNSFSVIESFH